MFLDSVRAVADGVRVAIKYVGRAAHRRVVVLPHPKRFEKRLPVRLGKIAKTVHRGADRLIIASGALTAAVARAGFYPGKPCSSGGSGAGPVMPGVARMTGGVFGATDLVTVAPVDMPERASAPRLLRS